ncbi:MAG: TIGR00282 family metallophosphoesterase [Phycisphaerae bacterium]|nr:TIGR00282 family metallophosphoesterase [Phycisphaerae bacterium]
MKVNVMCIGDVVGRPGRRILSYKLPRLVEELEVDCVIANAENAAGGSGLTPQIYDKLCKYGVHLVTLGDHCYRKRDIIPTLETQKNIIRPANLSAYSAGKDAAIYQTSRGATVGVVTLIGRIYMKPADCPYAKIDALLPRLRNEADILFVEVHAEATSEKVAMGYYLDGKVSCVFGTHTHVMTADERITAKGTACITDIGMTGAHDSVLGRNAESVVKAFRTQMPFPFDIAANDVRINAILVTVDSHTKKAEHIRRLVICEESDGDTLVYDSDDGRPDICNGF